jgi:hypothetical protein
LGRSIAEVSSVTKKVESARIAAERMLFDALKFGVLKKAGGGYRLIRGVRAIGSLYVEDIKHPTRHLLSPNTYQAIQYYR